MGCAINLGPTVVITGGDYSSLNKVSEYSEAGPTGRDLPRLKVGRRSHGCSYFDNDEGTKTLLVTGGYNAGAILRSSTELLEETATSWVLTGELPTPRHGLRVANIDNRILATGGKNAKTSAADFLDDILEFSPSTGEWTLVDKMMESRGRCDHAVSSIPVTDVQQFCRQALIISGGWKNSVEVFVPSTGQHCQLPDMPGDRRARHSMEKMTVCGGVDTSTRKSCITLSDGAWVNTTTLIEERYSHSSWASPSGLTIMMGGISRHTSEKI